MTYARSRLYLGISGVGFQVVLACVALWFGLPHRLLRGLSDLVAITLTLACYIALSIPSDLLGGYFLPRRHGRSSLGRTTFFAAWARGVLSQALVVGLCATAILQSARRAGTWVGIACFALLMFVLLAAQWMIAQGVSSFSSTPENNPASTLRDGKLSRSAASRTTAPVSVKTLIVHSTDPGFVGGIVGLPGQECIVLPSAWLSDLPQELLSTERIRRQGVLVTGSRTRGLAVAFTWNLLGFILACHLPGSSLLDAPGLVQSAFWFTLWSFAGLLLLPSINRPGVFEADRFALDHGTSPETLTRTISSLDRLQDDEPARTPWVERIFHPIPSVNNRIAALDSLRAPYGAWQSARIALYLSWACFGFLSRAVHCNAGRPELWVLFPGD